MHTSDRVRTGIGLLAALALALAYTIGFVPTAGAATEHCADHTTATKIVVDDDFVSPTTVTVTDTRTGQPIDVLVSVDGADFWLESGDPDLTLEDATWCIKSATQAHDGTGTSGTSGSTNKKGKVQDISYLVLYSVTTVDPTPVTPCNTATQSGGQGVTTTVHELGTAGPTSFLFEWETLNQPDQLEVFYEGNLIYDTGLVGDNINEGTGSDTVSVPAGTSTQITVVVTGPEAGTAWSYVVNCPAAP